MMHHIVSVSGGKDSTATYCKAIERGLPFRAVSALGEIYAEAGTIRDWLALTCVKRGWLTAHGRDPSRYLITPQGAEVAR